MWCVYLLWNPRTRQTYVGSTTDYWRRVSQHNRLQKGGASSTRRGAPDWQLACVLEGFKARGEACRWEAIIKRRFKGLASRTKAFWDVSKGSCPKGKYFDVPEGLSLQTWE